MALPVPLPEADEPVYYTADLVDALNGADGRVAAWYECVDGELLVTTDVPRPWHAALVDRLHDALRAYAGREPAAGYVLSQPVRFTFGRADVNVRPDVWAIRTEEWRAQDWGAVTVPLLLAEVLSPSTGRNDRFAKRRAYQQAGVPVYWIVDGDERWVEVWTPDLFFPTFEREQLVWHPKGAQEPFTLALAELFAPV